MMNPIVEYLEKNLHPNGNSLEIDGVDELMEEAPRSLEDIFKWTIEGREEGVSSFTPKTGVDIANYKP